MGRKTLVLLLLALAIPGVALAAKPTKPTSNNGKAAPKVMYVLKGPLSSYTAATSTATGSITIHVNHSNYHARALKGLDVTFTIAANTTVTLRNGTAITDGTRGVVKFRALKNITTKGLVSELTASSPMTAFQVIG
jgi:hypothetical protein